MKNVLWTLAKIAVIAIMFMITMTLLGMTGYLLKVDGPLAIAALYVGFGILYFVVTHRIVNIMENIRIFKEIHKNYMAEELTK